MSEEKAAVLVIDDNDDNRDLLARRLQRKGYAVIEAGDARQGLQLIQSQKIDLVLLDQMMPGIDGLQALKLIRQKYSSSDLPVIMVTARHDSGNLHEAMHRGANHYVTKPVDFPELFAQMECLLWRKGVEEQSAAHL